MSFLSNDKLLHAMQKIRYDEIEAKQQYFAEDLHNEDEVEFSKKYDEFRENYIEVQGSRNKQRQQGLLKTQIEIPDSQSKLIQALYPGVMVEDLTNQLLAIMTLVYMEELVEKSKVQSQKDGSKQIKAEHVKEVVRLQELRNENKCTRQFQSFF